MALVFSIKQTGVPVGAMMAGAIVPSLMLGIDWQWSLVVVAVACVVSAALSQPLREALDDLRQASLTFQMSTLTNPLRMVLGHRALSTMAACSFMFSMVQMSLTTYLVTYLHDDLAYGMVSAGLLLSVTQMGGIGGRIAWGLVADRWLGAQKTLALLAILMASSALATALLLPTLPLWGIWSVLLVFGASAIGWNGVYLAEVARQAPEGKASVATGGTLTFTFLGVVIGPPLFGALSSAFGTYRAGFLALVITSSLCAWVLYRLKPSAAQNRSE
jgi:MFS family permease